MKNCFIFLIMFFVYSCLTTEKRRVDLNIERAFIYYCDPEYVINVTSYVGRTSRTSNYKLNFSAIVIRPWYNNVTVVMKSFEFKNNQYKESFIRMSDKFCDALQKPLIWFAVPALQSHGNLPMKCPLVGHVYGNNFEFRLSSFPDNFPSSKWRFNFTYVQSPLNKLFLGFSISLTFQEYRSRIKAKEIGVLKH